ncbi:MAG: hypothetical protein E6J41_27210 [Chloroflexi bacterium]|nr:MAG: hypothetical protein E6J41_27210 [Chloroflexota bacterium]
MAEIEGEGRGPTSVLVAAVVAEAVERAGKALALARRIEPLIGRSYANRTVSAWARGDVMPPADAVFAAALVMGISLDDRLGVGREPSDLERHVSHLQGKVDVLEQQVQELLGRGSAGEDSEAARLLTGVREGLRDVARELDIPWEELPADVRDEELAPILEARMMDVRGQLGLDWSSPSSRTSNKADVARDLMRQLEEVKGRLIERRERRGRSPRRQAAN